MIKVAVLQKIVVDTYAVPQINEDNTEINWPSNTEWVDDRHSEFAIEEAVRIKEAVGDATIKTFSIRSQKLDKPILKALAKGIDEAVIIDDEDLYNGDAQAVGKALAEELKKFNPDIIVSGNESSDNNNFLVGPIVAAELGIPIISSVRELDVTEEGITASRVVSGRKETYTSGYPVLITTHKALNEPRYPKLPEIMKAKRKPKENVDTSIDKSRKIQQLKVEKQQISKEVTMIDGDDINAKIEKLIDALVNDKKVLQ